MKTTFIVLAFLILVLVLTGRKTANFSPPKTISEGFIALCPPGQMPASYTARGGECVPYMF
jgi:hypothetical protein